MSAAARLMRPAIRSMRSAAVSVVLCAAISFSILVAGAGRAGAQSPAPVAAPVEAPDAAPAGVDNPQRAWQHWTLNCQGCHRPDGTGSTGTAPSLAGTVARFLSVPGGREYLGRVPGVATSALSNADLSEVMNWMLWRFDKEHVPANFRPFTAAEIGQLRGAPLRLEASQMRAELLKKADESAMP
jgi:mono/diheme cytochrome c family protein